MKPLRTPVLLLVVFVFAFPALARGFSVVFDVASLSLNLDYLVEPQHVVYVSADPFYLELGAGWRYRWWASESDGTGLAAFARAEAVYSLLHRDFSPSSLAVGAEISPDGRVVLGAELAAQPLAWSGLPRTGSPFDLLNYVGLRAVAEYRLPLGR